MEHIPGRAQRCLARSQFGDRLNADPRGTARTPELWPGPTSLGASRPWPGPTALTTVSRRRGMRPANAFRRPVAHAADLDWGTPLARGRGDGGRGEVVGVRNTPARAGPTGRLPATPWRCTEHPRSRGADANASGSKRGWRGAPPLARGRQCDEPAARVVAGSTPARAGPTPFQKTGTPAQKEHPRSRGADTC